MTVLCERTSDAGRWVTILLLPTPPGKMNEQAVRRGQPKQLCFYKGAVEVPLINETLIYGC